MSSSVLRVCAKVGLTCELKKITQFIQRDYGDFFIKGIFLITRIDNPEMFQPQILKCDMHGSFSTGGIYVFKFKSVPLTVDRENPHVN